MNGKMTEMRSVMTASPHTIGVDQPLAVAKDLMQQHSIRHLPVLDGGQLAGIISDRDIDFALRVEKREDSELTVEDAFTAEPYTVSPQESLKRVSSNMASQRIGCAIVVEHGKPIGIFTTVDACRLLSETI